MFILINDSHVLPVHDDTFEDPLSILQLVYTNTVIDRTFTEWLLFFITPVDENLSDDEIKQIITMTLKNKDMLKMTLLRLFPTQYKFNLENWEYINGELSYTVQQKKQRKITLNSYEEHEKLFTTMIGKLFSI